MPAAHPVDGERALFGAIADTYRFRCPVCDACASDEVDTPCSAYCRGLAKKTSPSGVAAGGGRS